ncbi:right-handed parallel beta-helix repeat-containing protein [Planctomycetota bacterium]
MRQRSVSECRIVFAMLIIAILTPLVTAEVLYVDGIMGNDKNPGTKEKPLYTLGKAATLVNNNPNSGPTIIKILPGIYNLTQAVVFNNSRPYTKKDRLTIEAQVLPDDPGWKPQLMPMILSTEDPRNPEKPDLITGTYGIKIKLSHVTIRGLRFLGSPVPNNMHAPIERIDKGLEDLLVTQCMFVGGKDSFDIYCPVIATGHKFMVDHCIFHNCHASAVFWDGPEGISGKNNAMRYCIVDGGFISGVWTCQTSDDFEYHHNIVTNTEYFWMRKKTERPIRYKLNDCIINVNKFSGYGIESGPTGETGAEITYDRTNVIISARISLVEDKNKRDYMHVVPGTFGSDLGAGLFTK